MVGWLWKIPELRSCQELITKLLIHRMQVALGAGIRLVGLLVLYLQSGINYSSGYDTRGRLVS